MNRFKQLIQFNYIETIACKEEELIQALLL